MPNGLDPCEEAHELGEVKATGGEEGIDAIANLAEQEVSDQTVIVLGIADDRLNRAATLEQVPKLVTANATLQPNS